MSRITAATKWFDAGKGYGFLLDPNGGSDIFVHKNDLRLAGVLTLREGQLVSCLVKDRNGKGKQAINISVGTCPHCGGTGRGERDVEA